MAGDKLISANALLEKVQFRIDTPGIIGSTVRDMVATTRRIIEEAPAVLQWTPAAEPPKDKGCYFVTVKHWLDGKPVTREAYWNSVDWLSCERRHEITPRVTYWMRLPEPMEEEMK